LVEIHAFCLDDGFISVVQTTVSKSFKVTIIKPVWVLVRFILFQCSRKSCAKIDFWRSSDRWKWNLQL